MICLTVIAGGIQTFSNQSLATSSTVGNRELPIYCVETEKPQVALSFDAAWGNEQTQKLLDILADNEVKATFFMTGGWVDTYPDDVKKILAAGHDLGNHSENHKNMSQISDSEKKEEILSVHNKVKALTGYEMFLFRPPFGDYNNALITTLTKCSYYTIQWDVDSLDWKDHDVDTILRTVCENSHLGNGLDIIWMAAYVSPNLYISFSIIGVFTHVPENKP